MVLEAMKSDDLVFWQRVVAMVMVMPAGAVPAYYMAMVGFYALNFQSNVYFIGMLFAMYVPYPILIVMQHKLDAFFDERFSTKTTYLFRVVCLQFMLALIGVTWMLVPQSPSCVLLLGIAIGTVASANISSCQQLCAAMSPQLPQFAMIGEQIGSILPIITFALLSFDAGSSLHEFRMTLLILPVLCTIVAVLVGYFHFKTDMFEKAYLHLAYRDDPQELDSARSISEQATPHHPPDDLITSPENRGVPQWVWYWIIAGGFMATIEGFVLSLMPMFGNPSMAQKLALMKLAVQFLAMLLAIPVGSMEFSQHGPRHEVMTSLVVGHVVLALVLLAKLAKVNMYTPVFLLAWCVFNAWYRFTCSFSSVITLSNVKVQYRKLVARTELLAALGCVLIGVVLAFAVVHFLKGLDGTWPSEDRVIALGTWPPMDTVIA